MSLEVTPSNQLEIAVQEVVEIMDLRTTEAEMYLNQVINACTIFEDKYLDYTPQSLVMKGESNWSKLGLKGIFARAHDKMNRLQTLVWEEQESQVYGETVEDTLTDLLNYCVMGLICIRTEDLTEN